MLAIIIALGVGGLVKAVTNMPDDDEPAVAAPAETSDSGHQKPGFSVQYQTGGVKITTPDEKSDSNEQAPENAKEKKKMTGLAPQVSQQIFEILWLPIVLFITSFTSVVTALLYFKTRQAGGETMQDLLDKFEETESAGSRWQQRVRERLVQSGRVTSGSSSSSSSSVSGGGKKISTG